VSDALVLAGVMMAALVAYGVLAGADFGGGVWDLFASGPRKEAQRDAIARAIAPVWEANHVWLILVIVVLFTAFPAAYAALSIGLFVPFHLVLVGITLRGAAFVFRAYGPSTRGTRIRWGAVFGAASTITPILLGMTLGAISSGGVRISPAEAVSTTGTPWLTPLSIVLGAFAITICAYLAAVFLTLETDGDVRDDFRRRALASGTVLVALSAAAIPLLAREAPHLWRGLLAPRALPVVVLGVLCALASGLALRVRAYRIARVTSIGQVAFLLAGWCLAEFPYLVFPDLTLEAAAAPQSTLRFVIGTLPVGALLIAPSLWFLFRVFKQEKRAR
jgi:cytochrome d ubiquinol oxidase subunit II